MRSHAFGLCSLTTSSVLCLLPAAALAAPPALSNYVGKDPREKVRGVTFLHHPTVLAGVRRAVPAGDVQTWVLSDDSTSAPIASLGGKLLAHACESHNCGYHEWSILIDPTSGATNVCYHDATTMGDGKSRWYLATGKTELRDADAITGGCPSRGN
jgi:hypothetical protein